MEKVLAFLKGIDLDNLPAWARHLAIVFGATFVSGIVKAIVDAGGVTGLDACAALSAAFNLAFVATAGAAVVLVGTPLTRQYGVGRTDLPPRI